MKKKAQAECIAMFGDIECMCDQPFQHTGPHSGVPARVYWVDTQTQMQLCGAVGPNGRPCMLTRGHEPGVHSTGRENDFNWQIVNGQFDY